MTNLSRSYHTTGFRILNALHMTATKCSSVNTFLKGTKKILFASALVQPTIDLINLGNKFGESGKYVGKNIASSIVGFALDEIDLFNKGNFLSVNKQSEKSIKAACGATCKVGTGFIKNPLVKIPIKSACVASCDMKLAYDKNHKDLSSMDYATVFVKGFFSSAVKESLGKFSSAKSFLKKGALGEWFSELMPHFGGLFSKIGMDKYDGHIKNALQYSSEKITKVVYNMKYFVKAVNKYPSSMVDTAVQYSSDKINLISNKVDHVMKLVELTNKYFYEINSHSDIKIDSLLNDDFMDFNSTDLGSKFSNSTDSKVKIPGALPDLFSSMSIDISDGW